MRILQADGMLEPQGVFSSPQIYFMQHKCCWEFHHTAKSIYHVASDGGAQLSYSLFYKALGLAVCLNKSHCWIS